MPFNDTPGLAERGRAFYNRRFRRCGSSGQTRAGPPAGRSFNGRTADSDSAYRGSNPCLPAIRLRAPRNPARYGEMSRRAVAAKPRRRTDGPPVRIPEPRVLAIIASVSQRSSFAVVCPIARQSRFCTRHEVCWLEPHGRHRQAIRLHRTQCLRPNAPLRGPDQRRREAMGLAQRSRWRPYRVGAAVGSRRRYRVPDRERRLPLRALFEVWLRSSVRKRHFAA